MASSVRMVREPWFGQALMYMLKSWSGELASIVSSAMTALSRPTRPPKTMRRCLKGGRDEFGSWMSVPYSDVPTERS